MTHEPQPSPSTLARPPGLFARKGEALPATAAVAGSSEPLRAAGSHRCQPTLGRLAVGGDSPLGFLIERRAGASRPATSEPLPAPLPPPRPAVAAPRAKRPATATPVAAAKPAPAPLPLAIPAPAAVSANRRPLTVRLKQTDFIRLHAIAAAATMTYQSLLEAGVLRLLDDNAGKPRRRR
jgi:hypothetical protein